MKKSLLILCLIPMQLFAQEEVAFPDRMIKILPFEFANSTFMIEFEKFNPSLNESFSVGLGLTSAEFYNNEILGFKGELTKRFYVKGLGWHEPKRSDREPYIRGIYAGISLSGGYAEEQEWDASWIDTTVPGNSDENTKTGYFFFPGVTIGFTRSFWDILFMEVYVGGGVRIADATNSNPLYDENDNNYSYYYDNDFTNYFYKGVAPKIGLNLGIGF